MRPGCSCEKCTTLMASVDPWAIQYSFNVMAWNYGFQTAEFLTLMAWLWNGHGNVAWNWASPVHLSPSGNVVMSGGTAIVACAHTIDGVAERPALAQLHGLAAGAFAHLRDDGLIDGDFQAQLTPRGWSELGRPELSVVAALGGDMGRPVRDWVASGQVGHSEATLLYLAVLHGPWRNGRGL